MSNSLFINFFTVLTKEIGKWYEIKSSKLLSQKIRCSCFLFKGDHVFIEEEDNPSDNVVTVTDELHGFDKAGIKTSLIYLGLCLSINKMGILK